MSWLFYHFSRKVERDEKSWPYRDRKTDVGMKDCGSVELAINNMCATAPTIMKPESGLVGKAITFYLSKQSM